MNSYVLTDTQNVITNIIALDSAEAAESMGARPYYVEAEVGQEYSYPGLSALKEQLVSQSKIDLASYLESHPLTWTDKLSYSITQEKQAQLTSTLVCAQADGQPPEWNSTGGVCKEWDVKELTALGVAIKDRVKALVKYQQKKELEIRAATTQDELDAIVVDYDTVPVPQLPEDSQ